MHCLKQSSILLLFLFSCAAPYKNLQRESAATTSALRFKPEFGRVLYRCVVDGRIVFRKFHLSGLLFFKDMHDGSTRVVFQNEMGFTFFDFEWDQKDRFKVNQIIPQLNKQALIETLEKDMSLLLMKNLNTASETVWKQDNEVFHRFNLEKGIAYYITRQDQLVRIENAGKSKVTTITLSEREQHSELPSTIVFDHHKANFTIRLNKIDDAED